MSFLKYILALFVLAVSTSAFANDSMYYYTLAILEVDNTFDAGETALSAVFASTIEIYVIRRVWRIIRSSI